MNLKRVLCFTLAAAMPLSMLCSCKSEQAHENVEYKEINFPLESRETINIWTPNYASSSVNDYSQMKMYTELMDEANVDITFTHPSLANVAEQFNIMIASNELPDIFEQGEDYYKGGLVAAYDDGVIIDIMDYIAYAPNLKAIMDKYPQLKGEICDEEGRLLAFPIIRGGNNVRTYVGPVVRKDILEKNNIKEPETIDDWYEMLKALKSAGVESPLSMKYDTIFDRTVFSAAYGIIPDYYIENGKVVCGYYDPRFKDYIETLRKWYSEGLIDADMMVISDKDIEADFVNGKTGAAVMSVGRMKTLEVPADNKEFKMEAVAYPSLGGGQVPYMVHRDKITYPVASITKQCKNKALAVKLLDYYYGYEGNLLANFGIENESYTMKDGKPVYTDYITKNPDGKTMSQAGLEFSRAFSFGPFVQDKVYGEQWYSLDIQKKATELWTKDIDVYNQNNPYLYGSLTPAEVNKTASKQTDIETYFKENVGKIIQGKESVEKLDDYFAQLKKLGIEDVIATKQAAYDRFIAKYPELKNGSSYEVSDFFWNK